MYKMPNRKRTRNKLGRNLRKQLKKDPLTIEKRSDLMSKIRSKNTKFEEDFLIELNKKINIPYETNVASIRGKPDIVFYQKKICIFLDSDFWHGWQYPRWKHLLKNEFWRNKIENNRRRDRRISEYLRRHNWQVIRIWGHKINENLSQQLERIKKLLYE